MNKARQQTESTQHLMAQSKQELQQQLKANEALVKQRDIWRKRFVKLKARKGNTTLSQICKKCNQEYDPLSNFNWSCRTHQSEYSGEMWWCCGKLTIDSLGCKFNKHVCKREDDSEECQAPKNLSNC